MQVIIYTVLLIAGLFFSHFDIYAKIPQNNPLFEAMNTLNKKIHYQAYNAKYKNILITQLKVPSNFPHEIKNYLIIKLLEKNKENRVNFIQCLECINNNAESTNGILFSKEENKTSYTIIKKYNQRFGINLKLEVKDLRYTLKGTIIDYKTKRKIKRLEVATLVNDKNDKEYKITIGAGIVLGHLYGFTLQSLYPWPSIGEGGIKLTFLTGSQDPKMNIFLMPQFDWNLDELIHELFLWGDTYITTGVGMLVNPLNNQFAVGLGLKQTLFSHFMFFSEFYRGILLLKNSNSIEKNTGSTLPIRFFAGVAFDF